ncbi:hypothetical protein ASPBRDRAFT_41213 [Aspergillus brasiliensis CBS 101740]|uniref:Uncharacterized protein n=1 Tax=Aspergillus brasiliensis (strain CBS 101740 / IMI 381727 / IBT 21946) TaxID=767769 RepID=A0A1L9UPG5_ASPBC|nr:hypothetical protein ASPBRDRAFT_41213 [Aspergillus brasiliensis CBS 101740]
MNDLKIVICLGPGLLLSDTLFIWGIPTVYYPASHKIVLCSNRGVFMVFSNCVYVPIRIEISSITQDFLFWVPPH